MTNPWLGRRLWWLGIAAAVGVLYAGALDAPFVYDDKIEVIGNRTIRFLEHWRAIATYNVSRPLLIFSYAWCFDRWGLDPRGYHVVNLVIHALGAMAALSLGEALARLGRHPRPLLAGGLAAGLWAVHPMGTEAVTYITGRSESLCALFFFAGLAAWARALLAEAAGEGGGRWRALGALGFAGAVMSKEVGAVFPAVALAMEVGLGRPARPGRLRVRGVAVGWFVGFAAVIAAAASARFWAAGLLLPREVDRPLAVQLTTQAEVWLRYLQLWLVPVGQTIFHHQPDVAPGSGRGVAAWAGFAALLAGGVWWGRRVPLAGFALASVALLLVPSSSFVPLKESMAEHRSHAAGFFVLLAGVFSLTAPRRDGSPGPVGERAVIGGAAVLAAVLGAATLARNAVWSDEVALWEEATARRPDSADAWYGLGDARRFANAFDGAEEAYRRATELDPGHLDAWNNLGITRAELGDADGAAQAWKAALKASPTYCKAHNNLGFLALRRQQWDVAIVELRTTLAYCPDNVLAHWGLGNVYFGPRRDVKAAERHYQAVLDLDPDFDKAEEVRQRLLELTW